MQGWIMPAGNQADIGAKHDFTSYFDVIVDKSCQVSIDENIVTNNEISVEIQIIWVPEEKILSVMYAAFQKQCPKVVYLQPKKIQSCTQNADKQ